ncbi:MAG: NAD-binding oxidoreductase [Alphaproteobacteria bacterium]|nr:NAD-binding oxidoreductase [Alphaproteobacteria bacterium]
MNDGTNLRVAFAGAGLMSQFQLNGWSEVDGADIVAICDPTAEKAEQRSREYDIPAVYEDFAQMLEQAKPDAVDIATPVDTHADLVRIAADHGVHACSQKPVTPTVAEAESLIADVGERVRFMVHENFRWRPHYLQMREWLDDDRIGRITHARMTVRSPGLAPSDDGSTPPDLVRQPYLATFKRLITFELLIHQLDVLRSLLGELEVVSVEMDRVNKDLVGEDIAIIVMRGETGITVVVDGSMSAPGYPARPSDRLELIGTKDTMVFDRDKLFLVGSDAAPVQHDLMANYQACFTNAVKDFANGVRTGEPFWTDRLDNLKTLQLMERCYEIAGVGA